MINTKNYSKIRLLIAIIFVIVTLGFISQMLLDFKIPNSDETIQFSGCNPCRTDVQIYKQYLEILLLLTGIILFTLNKKLTDYISFTIFVFLLALLPVQFIDRECLLSDYFGYCMKVFMLVSLFLGLPIIFLTTNFIKATGKA